MSYTLPSSDLAHHASKLVHHLQSMLAGELGRLQGSPLEPVHWLRDEGAHGGGVRMVAGEGVFDRASVNVSQVHYDDNPTKRLASATALSTIVHPRNPHASSMHMHISWTEMRDGSGYWRVMADLNPSVAHSADKAAFLSALETAAGEHFSEGAAQGDKYFFIPALGRHRGVAHFYLEGHNTGDFEADMAFARSFGEQVIQAYTAIIEPRLGSEVSEQDQQTQLAYHTLYLFQVLTLDRGTTSGLLVHNQNDVGILGSLPSHVSPALLASWADAAPAPQGELVQGLVNALPSEEPALVSVEAKQRLANEVRKHYQAHPEALKLQASGNTVPPTVTNHR